MGSAFGNAAVCAIIDARNGNGYGAVYRDGACVTEPTACELEPFEAALPDGCRCTGTAAGDGALPSAASVVRIAAKREGTAQASPMYLKPSQAERLKQ